MFENKNCSLQTNLNFKKFNRKNTLDSLFVFYIKISHLFLLYSAGQNKTGKRGLKNPCYGKEGGK